MVLLADSVESQPNADAIGSNPWLSEAHARYQKQLEAHGIDLEKEPWILGSGLNFDARTERFSGTSPAVEKANSMLKRQAYREPFAVPEKV